MSVGVLEILVIGFVGGLVLKKILHQRSVASEREATMHARRKRNLFAVGTLIGLACLIHVLFNGRTPRLNWGATIAVVAVGAFFLSQKPRGPVVNRARSLKPLAPLPPLPRPLRVGHLSPEPAVASRYPTASAGGLGSFFRAFGALVLVAVAATLFFVRTRTAGHVDRISTVEYRYPRAEQTIDSGSDDADDSTAWTTVISAERGSLADQLVELPIGVNDRDTVIESRFQSDARKADEEALNLAGQAIGVVSASRAPYDVSPQPLPPDWIAQNLVTHRVHIEEDSNVGTRYKTKIWVDLSPERWEQIQHYQGSQIRQERGLGLAKVYAGSILIVGGLSIFLRLGTGIRPKPAR